MRTVSPPWSLFFRTNSAGPTLLSRSGILHTKTVPSNPRSVWTGRSFLSVEFGPVLTAASEFRSLSVILGKIDAICEPGMGSRKVPESTVQLRLQCGVRPLSHLRSGFEAQGQQVAPEKDRAWSGIAHRQVAGHRPELDHRLRERLWEAADARRHPR